MKKLLVVLFLILTLALFTACKEIGTDVIPTEVPSTDPTATPVVTVEPTATRAPSSFTYSNYDFSDDTVNRIPKLDGWTFLDVSRLDVSTVKAEEDNNYFYMEGFINLTFDELIKEGYTFSFDVKGIFEDEVAAVFVRGNTQLTLDVQTNPHRGTLLRS